MRASGPTFWLLDGRNGWRSGTNHAGPSPTVALGERAGISLAPDPAGPVALGGADGSLGGLRLPRGLALDRAGLVYLLRRAEPWLARFDPERRAFAPLPLGGGGRPGAAPFVQPRAIAIAGGRLYIADPGARTLWALSLSGFGLVDSWRNVEPTYSPIPVVEGPPPGRYVFLADPAEVVARLRFPATTLDEYVRGRLSARTLVLLDGHGAGLPVPAALREALEADLDQVVRGPSIYERARFRRFALSAATRARIGHAPNAELNRALLEEAFRGALDTRAWLPTDVVAAGEDVYVLDRRYGRVYRHGPADDDLKLVVERPTRANRWSQLAADDAGRIYLLDAGSDGPRLELFGPDGTEIGQVGSAGTVRERFASPAIRMDHRLRFRVAESLARLCDRAAPQEPPTLEDPLGRYERRAAGAPAPLIFDRDGVALALDPLEPYGPPIYLRSGVWHSPALDSERDRCQWHRVELELGRLPEGATVRVSTFAADELIAADELALLQPGLWDGGYTIVAPMAGPTGLAPEALRHEFLVQSREGRYLWLKLELAGDGYTTPAVRSLRVHYPRESYLGLLPAIFQADDESRWFLERFLSVFQTEWDNLTRRVEELAAFYDPRAVPTERGGVFLAYLADLLGLPLEGDWTAEQRRRLLAAAPRLTPLRGTAEGLRGYLQIYLENLTGLTSAEQGDYPLIVEGFRERNRAMLGQRPGASLGQGAPLWGPAQVGRLQLDVFAREGEVRLIGTGDPERDLFHEHAHRFRVFLPAAWVRSGADERMLRRALDAEKPAHTSYDLCLVEPRLRVGLQSTIGVDMIVGDYPQARLACAHEDAPPSRAPSGRLGYDTVLAAATAREWRLMAPSTLGITTRLP